MCTIIPYCRNNNGLRKVIDSPFACGNTGPLRNDTLSPSDPPGYIGGSFRITSSKDVICRISVSTLGGGSMVSLNGPKGSKGVPSMIREALAPMVVYPGGGLPSTNDGGRVVKCFANYREGKRDRDMAQFEKRHQELRGMSTKSK
jgi:hypothetical protein